MSEFKIEENDENTEICMTEGQGNRFEDVRVESDDPIAFWKGLVNAFVIMIALVAIAAILVVAL